MRRRTLAAASAQSWLTQFERALSQGDEAALHGLFHADSHWRDILALTWNIQTIGGSGAIAEALAPAKGKSLPALRSIRRPHAAARHDARRHGCQSR